MRRWSSAGLSSPVELHSLCRVYGRRAVVQAASNPSPRSQWIQGNDISYQGDDVILRAFFLNMENRKGCFACKVMGWATLEGFTF